MTSNYFSSGRLKKLFLLLPVIILQGINSDLTAQVYTQDFNAGLGASSWTNTDLTVPWGNGTTAGIGNEWQADDDESGQPANTCGTSGALNFSLYMGWNFAGLGAAYENTTLTNRRIASPNISTIGYTSLILSLNFIGNGLGTTHKAYFQYSIDGGLSWIGPAVAPTSAFPALAGGADLSNLKSNNAGCAGQGRWTNITWNMPAACEGIPNLRIAFVWQNDNNTAGSDPCFAADDVGITGTPTASNTITTGVIAGSPFCACDAVTVPFTSTGTFNAGNIYTAQLSNALGSFAAPTAIGTLVSTANLGSILATIPCLTPTGTQYRIRVVSDNPVTIGTANLIDITINQTVAAAVSITASPGSTICTGSSVTFTATNTNSISTPVYQWYLNGLPVGAGGTTYTNGGLLTGDDVYCAISSAAACVTGSPANSNHIIITVSGTGLAAAVSIVASQNPICTGTSVTFTATNTNGIPGAVYQWYLNGAPVGGGGTTYTNAGLLNGDQVSCTISSADPCVTGSPAFSNTIIMAVSGALVPSVTITVSPNDSICVGDAVTFTATPLNGGLTPAYSWTVNAAAVGVGTTYSSSTLNNGDVVVCIMTSSLPCATGGPVASNVITMFVDPGGVTSVTITSSPGDTICPGTAVTFTAVAVNAGFTPTYQWYLNATPVGAGGTTYSNSTLVNGDVITVDATSSSLCTTGSPATSNAITMVVATTLVASVDIIVDPQPVCQGDPVNFTATPVNGGTPVFQWLLNGNPVGSNSPNYGGTGFMNGDVVVCVLISSDNCASGSPASSNSITLIVDPCPPPVASFTASASILCLGECLTLTDKSTNLPTSIHWTFDGGNPSESTDPNPTVCYSSPGKFSVFLTATNSRGTDDTIATNIIEVYDQSPVNAGDDVEIQLGTSATLHATGGNEYLWTPGNSLSCTDCSDPEANPSSSTYYVVHNTVGCQGSDTVLVKVFSDFEIYVPNAFSPNADGFNDVLFVRGNGIKEINFIIYDRIGEKVFSSTSVSNGWDGRFRGRSLNSGVFSYYLKAYMQDGSEQNAKGNVTLFK